SEPARSTRQSLEERTDLKEEFLVRMFTVCRYLSSPRKMQVWQRYYIPDMSVAKVDDSIEKALQVWAKVTPLRFRRIYSSIADIMISFSRSGHGDGSPLDGPDGNLPHAFGQALGIGGDAHIDDDETFTFHSNTGDSVTLFLITAQDAGRSLGLSHSDDPGALMYSVYSYSNLDTFVLPWDLKGIKSLYNGPTNGARQARRLRLDPGFGLRGEMLFFKDDHLCVIRFFWCSHPQLVTPQQAVITNFWPDASVIIDAAYETRCCVWAFSGYDLMTGYPKSIPSFGLPTAVEKDTLFFVGSSYYRYVQARVDMDDGNPKQVDDTFLEMSSGVTAALLYRGEHLSSCFQGSGWLRHPLSAPFLRCHFQNQCQSRTPSEGPWQCPLHHAAVQPFEIRR
uniref:Peptidase metallopeptidase domain-containing protein n=1 Tax=Pundamilia nyererei TaxID=303518 RepID=A0A3B4F483_9CICH